jgi:hypothetical protein
MTLAMSAFFSSYALSVILFFFPEVKRKTDAPLLIGAFSLVVPLAPLFIMRAGFKKGCRRWKEW